MNLRSLMPFGRQGAPARTDDPFFGFQREMNRLFDDFFRGTGVPAAWNGEGAMLAPRIEIKETDRGVTVFAELPGVEAEDVKLELADNVLTIRGEKKQERDETAKGFHVTERSYGTFLRQVPLPYEADPAKVEAKFNKGVLTISVPKPPETERKARAIEIKA